MWVEMSAPVELEEHRLAQEAWLRVDPGWPGGSWKA